MSDFYQILKREITPQPPTDGLIELEKGLGEKKRAVDKTGIILSAQRKKKILAESKKTIRKKNSHPAAKSIYAGVGSFLSLKEANPIWLTMSETAKLGGIQKRTVKRALRAGSLKYRIIESRYQVDLHSALIYLFSKKKLWNKVKEFGIGQYIEKWKK
jgi:hypothetical protein